MDSAYRVCSYVGSSLFGWEYPEDNLPERQEVDSENPVPEAEIENKELVPPELVPEQEINPKVDKLMEGPPDSIEEINVSRELYKKKPLYKDKEYLNVPFDAITGESPLYLGCTTDGIICLSDYRLFVSVNPFFNIPLGLIEQVDFRESHHLYIHCKNAQTFRCTFSENTECQKWQLRIQSTLVPNPDFDRSFSFAFFSWTRDEKPDLHAKYLGPPFLVPVMELEFLRMGFGQSWRLSLANSDYSLCQSYPQRLIVPAYVSDETLKQISAFRYCKRIPVVVWRHSRNGCVIARSSQPRVGFFGSPCKEDEDLIMSILEASRADCGPDQRPLHHDLRCLQTDNTYDSFKQNYCMEDDVPKILVVDARSYAAVFGNRAKGGGTEVSYSNCEVTYQNLTNIHGVRRSLQALRSLCAMPPDPSFWLSSLEGTKWLSLISSLISAAMQVVTAVDMDNRDVLVHCSDGWDRTPQITALAELLMDPYYRSKQGFRVLVEKEWLEFGHKFADRCGNYPPTDDLNERSPVFLQWLDCVYQILNQFPIRFEFNEQYLVKLMYHTYSCLFGTFLCNSDRERTVYSVRARTYCVWDHLNRSPYFHNHLYEESSEVLKPSFQPNILKFWDSVYFLSSLLSSGKPESPVCADNKEVKDEPAGMPSLVKTKSCDDISLAAHSSGRQRRSSDTGLELSSVEKLGKEIATSSGDLAGKQSDLPPREPESVKTSPHRTSECLESAFCKGSSKEPCVLVRNDTKPQLSRISRSNSVLNETESNTNPTILERQNSNFIYEYIDGKLSDSSGSCSNSVTPRQSRSSSGVPSSPCDDYVDMSNGIVPQHISDLDGSIIIRSEMQLQAWKQLSLKNDKIRKLEKELQMHDEFRSWLMNYQEEFKRWVVEVQTNQEDASDNDVYSLDDPLADEHEVQSSNGSDDSFVKIDHKDVAAAVGSNLEFCCNWKPRSHRDFEVMCPCFQPVTNKESRKTAPTPAIFSRRQCRQSVDTCNKLPDTVITATSN